MKIDPRAKREIKDIAAQMLPFKREYSKRMEVTGEKLIADGMFKLNGEVIDPKGVYTFRKVCSYEVNHEKEILKAYKKRGGPGIAAYIKKITEEIQERRSASVR